MTQTIEPTETHRLRLLAVGCKHKRCLHLQMGCSSFIRMSQRQSQGAVSAEVSAIMPILQIYKTRVLSVPVDFVVNRFAVSDDQNPRRVLVKINKKLFLIARVFVGKPPCLIVYRFLQVVKEIDKHGKQFACGVAVKLVE